MSLPSYENVEKYTHMGYTVQYSILTHPNMQCREPTKVRKGSNLKDDDRELLLLKLFLFTGRLLLGPQLYPPGGRLRNYHGQL